MLLTRSGLYCFGAGGGTWSGTPPPTEMDGGGICSADDVGMQILEGGGICSADIVGTPKLEGGGICSPEEVGTQILDGGGICSPEEWRSGLGGSFSSFAGSLVLRFFRISGAPSLNA